MKLIRDRLTGRSCGYGFIDFGSDADAYAAIEAASGREVDGESFNLFLGLFLLDIFRLFFPFLFKN